MTVLATMTPTVVHLSGDIDISTTAGLRRRILAALDESLEVLVVDMGAVTFCDAAGLGMLLRTQRQAEARGMTLALTRLTPQMTRLLDITELRDRFPILTDS
ncbi:STAS domain-containing protein [Herbidospora sp. NBRC 101105]|uniref:STAS domain-containing protein n=1 Tax=Herbidospora sp. NBRC 101105 TaxID=3032195 RepID=UPI0024A46693|nr:STAS domain-containing protein [Herbidospora sp. NBRC 101105]GLX99410.1 anti-sigma factor antagonist [Herbidospora sp. NBRC 101105]